MVMNTLEDEWCIVIKTDKFTIFAILRDFFVLPYIMYPHYLQSG